MMRHDSLFKLLFVIAFAGAGMATRGLVSEATAQPKNTAQPKIEAASPYAGVEQAKKNGATACLPLLEDLSKITAGGGKHVAYSTWLKEAPSQRAFSATYVSQYDIANAPRSVGLTMVAPVAGNHCDGVNMEVQPSKMSCQEVAVGISKQAGAPKMEKAGDVIIVAPNPAGQRVFLLPSPTTGCILVSTGTYFGK